MVDWTSQLHHLPAHLKKFHLSFKATSDKYVSLIPEHFEKIPNLNSFGLWIK